MKKRILVALAAALVLLGPVAAVGADPGGGNSGAAHACEQGGHLGLVGSGGETFANIGECVSFAGRGGTFARPPQITSTSTYTEGVHVYLRINYTDPDGDAQGFGFEGIGTWARETHPFTDPSYGRVSPGRVDYPFNHACGTASQYESDVSAWIYDSTGLKSSPVVTHLECS